MRKGPFIDLAAVARLELTKKKRVSKLSPQNLGKGGGSTARLPSPFGSQPNPSQSFQTNSSELQKPLEPQARVSQHLATPTPSWGSRAPTPPDSQLTGDSDEDLANSNAGLDGSPWLQPQLSLSNSEVEPLNNPTSGQDEQDLRQPQEPLKYPMSNAHPTHMTNHQISDSSSSDEVPLAALFKERRRTAIIRSPRKNRPEALPAQQPESLPHSKCQTFLQELPKDIQRLAQECSNVEGDEVYGQSLHPVSD